MVDYNYNNGNNPIIKDDGIGNLYSTNAHHSQSNNSPSSSDNYVGNIFYEKGLVILTETGSWSGSVNYSDLATNYNLKFKSVHTINTNDKSFVAEKEEGKAKDDTSTVDDGSDGKEKKKCVIM